MYAGTTLTSPGGTIAAEVLIAAVPQPLYRRADGRHFTAGEPGSAYTLRVLNLTGFRIEVITSVDGRNILEDEPADAHRNRGLVIGPHGSYDFAGWRISDEQTREFLFGDPQASVAAQATGETSNTGVIGFAAWQERLHDAAAYRGIPMGSVTASAGFAAKGMAAKGGTLGTGIGEVRHDPVSRTEFERTGQPDIAVIGYERAEVLREWGILRPADPDPFPATGTTGYAKYAR